MQAVRRPARCRLSVVGSSTGSNCLHGACGWAERPTADGCQCRTMDPAVALRELGGVGTLRELLAYTNRSQLAAALADGGIHKPRHNRLLPRRPRRLDARGGPDRRHRFAPERRAAIRVEAEARPGAALHHAAAQCPQAGRRVRAALGDLSERELRRNVTSRTRTVIDCARTYDFDVALCVADSALREGIIDADDLLIAAARSPRTGRAKALRVARRCFAVAGQPVRDLPPRDRDVGAGPRRRSPG